MRLLGTALCLALALTALTGCGDDREENPGSTAGTTGCPELREPSDELAAFGELSSPQDTAVGGLPACQAVVDDPDDRIARIQLIQVSAGEWAQSLPGIIDRVVQSGLVKDQAALSELQAGRAMIEEGEQLSDGQACELFTTLVVTLQTAEPGAISIVNVLPNRDDARAVNGQACSAGTYTSVQIEGRTTIDVTPALLDLVRFALADLHPGRI